LHAPRCNSAESIADGSADFSEDVFSLMDPFFCLTLDTAGSFDLAVAEYRRR
jgi:hypothetical protein